MSEAQTNKLYKTFLKGLFTEASPLTFPPDTSYDEDNCTIFVAGNRARRLGIDYEDNFVYSPYVSSTPATDAMHEFAWKNAGLVDGYDILVHQVGTELHFYNMSGTPTSPNILAFTLDMTPYIVPGSTNPEQTALHMSSGKGYLFIAGEKTEPLLVEYDGDTLSFTVTKINILIRDFDGVDDGIGISDEPGMLLSPHWYNLLNQGWTGGALGSEGRTVIMPGPFGQDIVTTIFGPGGDVTAGGGTIGTYYTNIGVYPGNNKQWFLGKVAVDGSGFKVGDFSPNLLNKLYVGNSRAPRGHFIFNAFSKDRSSVSGVPNIEPDISNTRPSSVAFAAGRAFYAHENNVYFSQIISITAKAGLCYQDNDPTAENFSDLLANDGGVIPIPSANKIVLIKEVSSGVMVFADNGVWFISGSDKGFTASDYQLNKVSSIGTDAPFSVIDSDDHIFWWSKTGIQRIQQASGVFGPVTAQFNSDNLTENTIDTFIKDVSTIVRRHIKGIFDPATKTCSWLYASNDLGKAYLYDRVLNFNTITESFYPWSLPSSSLLPLISGIYKSSDINRISNAQQVLSGVGNSNMVKAGGGNVNRVVASGTTLSAKDNFLQFIVMNPNGVFTIANFVNDDFVDWESYNSVGQTYTSYVETGFEILEDAVRKKQITWLQVFFRQTEENFVAVGDDYTVDKPSSCILTTKWDWANTSAANKWSAPVQVYRLKRVPFVNPLDLTLDTGFKIVSTKNKIRGQGRALQFRFEESGRGNNFDLLGWQTFYSGNTSV